MKINMQSIYISHKSETCVSKSGNPLSEYRNYSEAQESANYQFTQTGISFTPYECQKCGKFHLKPTEFYCEKAHSSCTCTDHNGNRKDTYVTREDAEKMVNIRGKDGVQLFVYQCPSGCGFHLTSSRGY